MTTERERKTVKGSSVIVDVKGSNVIVDKVMRGEQEVWRVSSDGIIKNLPTSLSSTSAMDQAVVIYDSALKRLADR